MLTLHRPVSATLLALALGGVFLACGDDDVTVPAGTPTSDGPTTTPVDTSPGTGPSVAPLDLTGLAEKTWGWFELAGASCRDGSPAGFGLNLGTAPSKIMIFLEGGGACFNAITCGSNPASVGARSASGGILDRARAENPVADWTFVYVPYCTGDVHAGNNPNGAVDGVDGSQKFLGYANMALYLRKLAATFPQTTRVLLTGTSAGGFGAAANYGQTARAFPDVPVNLVDDSGPAMRAPQLARCLQDRWTSLWKLDTTFMAECGAECAGAPDPLFAAMTRWTKLRPTDAHGVVSSTADQTIRFFFGFGGDACKAVLPAPMSAADYAAGLADIRAANATPSFGTLVYPGDSHTILGGAGFYSTDPARPIASWVRGIVETDTVTNVGP